MSATAIVSHNRIPSVAAIHVMENHDYAYTLWRDAGLRDRILVHIDAHHDMWRIDDQHSITIANFICPALQENIVREVYWVVPDATWDSRAGRAAIQQHLRRLVDDYSRGGEKPAVTWNDDTVTSFLAGKRLTICSLNSLPRLDEPVLLDIDTDYLLIPRVSYGVSDRHGPLPWCWPEKLINHLQARDVHSEFTTIVYSVEGGYTPLKWKYLGDELAARLALPTDSHELSRFGTMRDAVHAQAAGSFAKADQEFRSLGDFAPAKFHLASLLLEMGRAQQAREAYSAARALDTSYRTPYANYGFQLLALSSPSAAGAEFQRAMQLDPSDPHSHCGLGRVSNFKKQWQEAEQQFRSALALDPELVDAHRGLGKSLAEQRRTDEAIHAYEQSLRLALHGHQPVNYLVVSNPEHCRLLDTAHGRIHARLARLYEQKGARRRAIASYRIALSASYERPLIRLRLARLYAAGGESRYASEQVFQALRRLPVSVARIWRGVMRRISSVPGALGAANA